MSASHEARIRRALDRLNQGDLEGYLTLYADDAVLHGYGLPPGKDSIRAYYQGFLAAFPDAAIHVADVITDGDRVAVRYAMKATHRGAFLDIPATGRAIEVTGLTILRFEGDLVAERWAEANFLSLLQQLGALPAPGATDPRTLARTIYEHFSNDEFDAVLALADDDVEITFVPTGEHFHGHEGMRQFMMGFKDAFPDVRLDLVDQIVAGDRVVSEFIARGTHTGPLHTPAGDVPPTGRRAEWQVCEVWQVRDGKLAALHNYQDSATLARQLGLEGATA